MSVPALAVAGALLLTDRSAARTALVVAVELLLAALPSSAALVALTVAVLSFSPVSLGSMCPHSFPTRRSSDLLAASAPKVQTTVVVPAQPAEAETKVVPAGRLSLTVPPLQAEGPRLVTVIV